MNRIILIGNGFDLAQGLKTSYRDFIEDYWGSVVEKHGARQCIDDDNLEVQWRSRWATNIDPSLTNNYSRANYLIQKTESKAAFKNSFLKNISEKQMDQGWVDIENEYYKQLIACIKNNGTKLDSAIRSLNQEFERVKVLLTEYLGSIVGSLDMGSVMKSSIAKQIYAEILVGELAVSYQKNLPRVPSSAGNSSQGEEQKKNLPDKMLFLNFNYTELEKKYEELSIISSFEQISIDTIHIHGDLSPKENNPIIFGFGDELDENYKMIENLNDNRFLENIKSIKYLETPNYHKLLKFIENDAYEVFIFGHSCGNSDRTLLNTLFEHDNCVSIKVFYHQKADGSDNFTDIVSNITRNFQDKKKLRDRVVNKKYCEPMGQTKRGLQESEK